MALGRGEADDQFVPWSWAVWAYEWIEDRADFMTAITGVVALTIAALSFAPVARRRAIFRATLLRWWFLNRSGPREGRRVRWRKHAERVRWRFDGVAPTPSQEVDWISKEMGLTQSITFQSGTSDLFSLASAYRQLSARLRIRTLLGVTQPLLESESGLAEETSNLLLSHANRMRNTATPCTWVIENRAAGSKVWFLTNPVESGPAHVEVSWFRSRIDCGDATRSRQVVSLDDDLLRRIEQPLEEPDRQRLARLLDDPHSYDGVLPRLIDYRIERDLGNGAEYLHLSLGEMTYSAHRALSRPGASYRPDGSPLISMSMLVRTSDDFLVLAQRASTDIWYPNGWGPTVNGNLDMPFAGREDRDQDRAGNPDLVSALQREAVEELGLVVSADQVVAEGLIRVESASERGTRVMVSTAQIDQTADDLIARAKFGNRVTGSWEVTEEFMLVPFPRNSQAAQAIVDWAANSADAVPHLAGLLVCYLVNSGFNPQIRETTSFSAPGLTKLA